eukprot:symbB.v1.2.008505.t1/scaffold527.1/size293072/3
MQVRILLPAHPLQVAVFRSVRSFVKVAASHCRRQTLFAKAGHNTLTAIMRAKASLAHQQWTRRHCLQTALLKTALVKTAKVRSQRATGSSCHPLEPGA